MRKLFKSKFLSLLGLFGLAAVAVMVTSCEDDGKGDKGLKLKANKTTILNDSISFVQFSVTFDGKEVPMAEVTFREGTKTVVLTDGKFMSTTVGTARVSAQYKGEWSNVVDVVVKDAKGYVKNATVLYFTSTWCIWCPAGVGRLQACVDAYPGRINSLFFHEFRPSEPYEPIEIFCIPEVFDMETWVGGIGLPTIRIDNEQNVPHMGRSALNPTSFEGSFEKNEYVGSLGLAIDTKLDGRKLTTTVRVKNADDRLVDKDLRLVVWLKEDGLVYKQAKGDEDNQKNEAVLVDPYTHNNVVRACISGSNIGVELSAEGKAIGGEYSQTFEYTVPDAIAERPNDWKLENMTVVAYVYIKKGGAPSFDEIVNSQHARLGESVDYIMMNQ